MFCAVGNTTESPNCKTNEIANVCGVGGSFEIVMFLGVRLDNATPILLTC